MSFKANEPHEQKKMLKVLVAAILRDCRKEESEYILENIFPTLLPGLIQLLETYEKKLKRMQNQVEESKIMDGRELELKPLNTLASFLFRNNPRVNNSSNQVAANRQLIQDVILEERKFTNQSRFQQRLLKDTEREIQKLAIWPQNQYNEPQDCVSNRSVAFQNLLEEIEWDTGLAGLQAELQVVFEALDVRKTQVVSWTTLINVTQHWLRLNQETRRAKATTQFKQWLREELLVTIEKGVSEYYGTNNSDELFTLISKSKESENISWDTCISTLHEIKTHALGWEKSDAEFFHPEDVLDSREMKCCDEENITANDFSLIFDQFLDRLARARANVFSL